MTSAITLADPTDLPRVMGLMARFHEEMGLPYDDAHREAAAAPLLDGSPLGAVWLIGPARAPLGYVMIGFGWSVPRAGMVGTLEEVFIRPSVRRRGIGTETLHAIAVSLRDAGLRALTVSLPPEQDALQSFCERVGFRSDPPRHHMTDPL